MYCTAYMHIYSSPSERVCIGSPGPVLWDRYQLSICVSFFLQLILLVIPMNHESCRIHFDNCTTYFYNDVCTENRINISLIGKRKRNFCDNCGVKAKERYRCTQGTSRLDLCLPPVVRSTFALVLSMDPTGCDYDLCLDCLEKESSNDGNQ